MNQSEPAEVNLAHLIRQQKSGRLLFILIQPYLQKRPHNIAKWQNCHRRRGKRREALIGRSDRVLYALRGAKWDLLRHQSDRDMSSFADAPRPLKLHPSGGVPNPHFILLRFCHAQ